MYLQIYQNLAVQLGIILSQKTPWASSHFHIHFPQLQQDTPPVCRFSAFLALQPLPALCLATEHQVQLLVALSNIIANYMFCFPVQLTGTNVGLLRCVCHTTSHMGEPKYLIKKKNVLHHFPLPFCASAQNDLVFRLDVSIQKRIYHPLVKAQTILSGLLPSSLDC